MQPPLSGKAVLVPSGVGDHSIELHLSPSPQGKYDPPVRRTHDALHPSYFNAQQSIHHMWALGALASQGYETYVATVPIGRYSVPVFMGSNTCTLEVRAPEQGSVEAARVDEERKVLEMMQKVEPFRGSLPRYFFLNRVGIEQGMTYDYFGSEMIGGVDALTVVQNYSPLPNVSGPTGPPFRFEVFIRKLLRFIIQAVHHLHNLGIVHRDLVPENILVDYQADPRLMRGDTVRLINFRSAKVIDKVHMASYQFTNIIELGSTRTLIGTPEYVRVHIRTADHCSSPLTHTTPRHALAS